MCDCPFCATTPCATTLPLPVRLVLGEGDAHWAWLTAMSKTGYELAVATPTGRRRTASLLEATRLVCGDSQPMQCEPKGLALKWRAHLCGVGDVPFSRLRSYVHGKVCAPAVDPSATSRCVAGRVAPPPSHSATSSVVPLEAATAPPEPLAASPLAPLAPPSRAEASPQLPDTPPQASTSGVSAGVLASLGGDASKVAFILERRPTWDQETVDELLRWGAKPRMLKVEHVLQRRHFRVAECTFVHPDGRLVDDVWIPYGLVRRVYPDQAARYEASTKK